MAQSAGAILLRTGEGLLMLGAAGLVAWGRADGLAAQSAWAPWAAGGALAALFVAVIVFCQLMPALVDDWRTSAGMATVAFACIHLTKTTPAPLCLDSPLVYGYLAVLVVLGASGRLMPWAGALGIIVAGEGIAAIVKVGSGVTEYVPAVGLPAAALVLAGLLPYLVARRMRSQPSSAADMPTPAAPPAGAEPARGPDTAILRLRAPDSTMMRVAEGDGRSPGRGAAAPGETAGAPAGAEAAGVEEILASVVYFMRRNFDAYSALGFIFDPFRQAFALNSANSKSVQIPKTALIPLGKGIVGRVGAERRSFLSGDLSLYEGEIGYYTGPEMINSVLAVPILADERELLGVLVVDSKNKRVFTDQHKEIMRRFSFLAAALITNARMRIRQQKTARQFQVFYETAQRFTTALNADEVFAIVLDTMAVLANPTRTIAVTVDGGRGRGIIYRVAGEPAGLEVGFEFPLNDGLYALAVKKRSIVSIADYQALSGPHYRFLPDEPPQPSIRSLLILPIMDDASRCLGLLSLESATPNLYSGEMEQLLSTLVGNASVAVARALLYQKMEKLATTDGLTGLNNHRYFQDQASQELERSRRYNRSFSLILMDIDHFKKFNDTYGHPVGDQVLREIAQCIRRSIRTSDFPARYGGEEFVVILPENDERGALVTAERIRSCVENHVIRSGNQELRVTVSLGCATYPAHATDKASLIDFADKALYHSKEHGRNQATAYRKGM